MNTSQVPITTASRSHVLRRLDTDGGAVTLILLLALLAFSPWWAGGRILAPLDVLHETFAPWHGGGEPVAVHNHFTSDAVTQYLVYRRHAERSFAEDGLVGWNELVGGGRPDYANTMATYGDWTVQLHRWLDFWTAWHLGLLAQLLIAAFGMYALLRSERIVPVTALTAAIAFAAATPLIYLLHHRWHLAAFAWVPWLTWAVLAVRRGTPWAWPLVPVFLALALVGGSIQTAVFVLLVWVALWVGGLRDPDGRRGPHTLRFAVWGLLAAGLAAFTLVPGVLMYIDGLDLHGGRSTPGYEHGWLQPIRALLFIPLQIVPTLLGSPRSLDLAKLLHVDLGQIAFFGFVPMVIAMRCAFWSRTPLAARLLILAGLLIPLTPLVGALYHRVQIVFVFGGVWAFAWYWQHANPAQERWWRTLAVGASVAGVIWLAASVLLWLNAGRITTLLEEQVGLRLASGEGGQLAAFGDWMRTRAGRLVHELRIWHPSQMVAVGGIGLGLAAVELRRRGRIADAGVVLLSATVLQLGGLAVGWHRAVDPQQYAPYPGTPDLRRLQELASGGRVHVAAERSGSALFLPPNTLAMYDVATIDQFETVDVPGMWQATGRATDAQTLGRLGVTHAVAPPGLAPGAGWTLAHDGATLAVWSNDAAVPRYVAVPAGTELDSALEWAGAGRAARPVQVVMRTQNRRTLLVPEGTGSVRVSENWSEGWQYRRAGGAWAAVVPAMDRSMLLPLEPGASAVRVELRYRPARRIAGWSISILSLAVTLAAATWVVRGGAATAGAGGRRVEHLQGVSAGP